MSITAHTLVGLKDAITSLTPVVLGTFEPSVRVMLSEGVAVTEGASSRSIGVEAMLGVPARAGLAQLGGCAMGWRSWEWELWELPESDKFCRAVRANGLGPLHSTPWQCLPGPDSVF